MNPTLSRIAEIEERVKRATPGPWFVAEQPFDDRLTAVYGDNKAQVACDPHGARLVVDCDVTMEWTEGEPDQSVFDRANARLIARAPSDLAFLTKALRVALEGLAFVSASEPNLIEEKRIDEAKVLEQLSFANGTIVADRDKARSALTQIAELSKEKK